jgi:hypothetical protein
MVWQGGVAGPGCRGDLGARCRGTLARGAGPDSRKAGRTAGRSRSWGANAGWLVCCSAGGRRLLAASSCLLDLSARSHSSSAAVRAHTYPLSLLDIATSWGCPPSIADASSLVPTDDRGGICSHYFYVQRDPGCNLRSIQVDRTVRVWNLPWPKRHETEERRLHLRRRQRLLHEYDLCAIPLWPVQSCVGHWRAATMLYVHR